MLSEAHDSGSFGAIVFEEIRASWISAFATGVSPMDGTCHRVAKYSAIAVSPLTDSDPTEIDAGDS